MNTTESIYMYILLQKEVAFSVMEGHSVGTYDAHSYQNQSQTWQSISYNGNNSMHTFKSKSRCTCTCIYIISQDLLITCKYVYTRTIILLLLSFALLEEGTV